MSLLELAAGRSSQHPSLAPRHANRLSDNNQLELGGCHVVTRSMCIVGLMAGGGFDFEFLSCWLRDARL